MASNGYQYRNDPTRLILFLLVVLGLYGSWVYAQRMPGVDYYVAWTVVDATRNNRDYRVYDWQDQKRMQQDYRDEALSEGMTSRRAAFARLPRFQATASPFLYSTVSLLSTSKYESSLKIWNALSLAGVSAAILMFSMMLGFSRTATLAIFATCLFWLDSLNSDIRVANINGIQLGLLSLTFYLLSRDSKDTFVFLAGAAIAMLVVLKINLAAISLLLLGAWLIRGEWRKFYVGLAGMVVGTIVAVVVSSLFFGSAGIWTEWLKVMFDLSSNNLPLRDGNINMFASLGLDVGLGLRVALVFVLCGLTLFFLWWGRKVSGQLHEGSSAAHHECEVIEYAQLIGMGCVVYLLVSPLVWVHYYLLAIPMLIVCFRPWSMETARGKLGVALLRLAPTLVLLALIEGPHWIAFQDNFQEVNAISYSISAIVLFILGLWQLRFQDGRIPVGMRAE